MIEKEYYQKVKTLSRYHLKFDVYEIISISLVASVVFINFFMLALAYQDLFRWLWYWQSNINLYSLMSQYFGKNGYCIVIAYIIFNAYIVMHCLLPYLITFFRKKSKISSRKRKLWWRLSRIFVSKSIMISNNKVVFKSIFFMTILFIFLSPLCVYLISEGDYQITFIFSWGYSVFALVGLFILFAFPVIVFAAYTRRSAYYQRSVMVARILKIHKNLEDKEDFYIISKNISEAIETLSILKNSVRDDLDPGWIITKLHRHSNYLKMLYGWCFFPGKTTRSDLINEIEVLLKVWTDGDLSALKELDGVEIPPIMGKWKYVIGFSGPIIFFLTIKWAAIVNFDTVDYLLFSLLYLMFIYWLAGGTISRTRLAIEDAISLASKRVMGGG